MNKKKKIDELNELYNEAEQLDSEVFSEQRSNILLVSGDHYTRKNSRWWNRIRDNKDLSNEQKLRLTKNHTQNISKKYTNSIITYAPGVSILPKNENELQDQKSAELNQAIWLDWKHRSKYKQKVREFAQDFIDIGEVFSKTFFDPMVGKFLGYEAEVDEFGEAILDENGQYSPSSRAIFRGDIVCERIFGFNLLRHPDAKSHRDPYCKMVRKMVDIETGKSMFTADDERSKFIEESMDETFMVFEAGTGAYSKAKDQFLMIEYFYPPCHQYPNGYFYITTKKGILFEGELPFGVFPIQSATFDEVQTSPRGRSIIKHIRPYQAEINRAGSKIAEHQITIGDDKILYQSGSKLSQGKVMSGVRGIEYAGAQPTIMPGRAGDQYLSYMNSQIEEMYRVANIYEELQDKQQNTDAYAVLFQSVRNKKKFTMYAEKFEEFLIDQCEAVLTLARGYYEEDMIIPAIGRAEAVNIAEFKNTTPLQYSVRVEARGEDMETQFGKQLVLNQVMQYVGSNLEKEDIGKLVRNMPFANLDESFRDLTLNYDMATNIILALDRGEYSPPQKYQDHKYIIRRLVDRTLLSDFRFMSPEIQQNYARLIQEHEMVEAQEMMSIKAAQSEFIPTGGYLVACDFYVTDGKDSGKTKRARIPYESLAWLMKRLETQGMSQESLEKMRQGAIAELSQAVSAQANQGRGTLGQGPLSNTQGGQVGSQGVF